VFRIKEVGCGESHTEGARQKVSIVLDANADIDTVFLFSDFDGTLAPIRKDPAKVTLSLRARKVLIQLSHSIPVAIISGRSLAFLEKTIAIPGVFLAGNHGLEIKMGADHYRHPEAVACEKMMQRLANTLKKAFRGIDGILIEEKGLTLTFHYRQVVPHKREVVCKMFYDRFVEGNLKITAGKMALEVRPNIDWGKKDAILWMLENYKKHFPKRNVVPIYVGDDETDRVALEAIKKIGISIAIGVSMPATFFLPSQTQYIELLRQVQLDFCSKEKYKGVING